jgi:hypothetical protein
MDCTDAGEAKSPKSQGSLACAFGSQSANRIAALRRQKPFCRRMTSSSVRQSVCYHVFNWTLCSPNINRKESCDL